MPDWVLETPTYSALPVQDRRERAHLYAWISLEEGYVSGKFDDQRDGHDETLRQYDVDGFWTRQVMQYYDRARAFLAGAKDSEDPEARRFLEMKAQQAITKAMMVAKGFAESSIRVFGPLPTPGVSSGNVSTWEDPPFLSEGDK